MPVYTERLDQAIEAIENFKVTARGFTFADRQAWLDHWTFCGGIPYETSKTGTFALNTPKGRGKWLQVTLYRMPSGRYEIVAYVS